MKALFLICLIFTMSSGIKVIAQEKEDANSKNILLRTSNGCGYQAFLMAAQADSALGIPSSLGFLPDYIGGGFTPTDTLPGTHIVAMDFENEEGFYSGTNNSDLFAVATDSGIYIMTAIDRQYRFEEVASISIPADQIYFSKSAKEVVIINWQSGMSRVRIINYLTKIVQFDSAVNYKLSWVDNQRDQPYSMIGNDTAGNTHLLQIDYQTYLTTKDTVLDVGSLTVKGVRVLQMKTYVIASEGDSFAFKLSYDRVKRQVQRDTVSYSWKFGIVHLRELEFAYQLINNNKIDSNIKVSRFQAPELAEQYPVKGKISALGYFLDKGWGFGVAALFYKYDFNDSIIYFKQYASGPVDSFIMHSEPFSFGADWECRASIDEIEKETHISVYPNPAKDIIHINIEKLASHKEYQFEIWNTKGKLIYSKTVQAKHEYQIPVESFPSGPLLLKVLAGEEILTQKIIKL